MIGFGFIRFFNTFSGTYLTEQGRLQYSGETWRERLRNGNVSSGHTEECRQANPHPMLWGGFNATGAGNLLKNHE